jgi:hypothetical protein
LELVQELFLEVFLQLFLGLLFGLFLPAFGTSPEASLDAFAIISVPACNE